MGALEQVEHEIAGLHSMLKRANVELWSRLKHEMGGLWSWCVGSVWLALCPAVNPYIHVVLNNHFVFSSFSKWAVGGDGRAYRYTNFENDGLQSGKNCKMVMFLGIFFVVVISENMLWSRNLGQKMRVFQEAQPLSSPPPGLASKCMLSYLQTQELKTCYLVDLGASSQNLAMIISHISRVLHVQYLYWD